MENRLADFTVVFAVARSRAGVNLGLLGCQMPVHGRRVARFRERSIFCQTWAYRVENAACASQTGHRAS